MFVKKNGNAISGTRITIRKAGSLLISLGHALRSYAHPTIPPQPQKQTPRKKNVSLALVAGYFSFKDGYATFGDTEAKNVVCSWLEKSDIPYDVACHHSNGEIGVDLATLDPSNYDIFIFVCGPWREANNNILERFNHCIKIGVNLSIEDEKSCKFDLLYPRDLPNKFIPDIVFSSTKKAGPLIGVCLVHPQDEYGERQRHAQVEDVVMSFLSSSNLPFINLDTLYVENPTGIKNTQSFERLLSHLDLIISSRLHGLVFSLKNGTPVVAIDAISGGAKLTNQVTALGWPILINGDELNAENLKDAVTLGLAPETRERAIFTSKNAIEYVEKIETTFLNDLNIALKQRDGR